jgi:hypothetical protein
MIETLEDRKFCSAWGTAVEWGQAAWKASEPVRAIWKPISTNGHLRRGLDAMCNVAGPCGHPGGFVPWMFGSTPIQA